MGDPEHDERPLDSQEARAALEGADLDRWGVRDGAIHRELRTDGWPTTLMLVNAVGYLCEAAWHHADLHASWGALNIVLSTHGAGGITARDIELARRIEDVVLWRPAPGDALEGTPKRFVTGDPAD